MIHVGKALISADVIQKNFCCDIKKCKGACCVLGDAGAPLEKKEIEILKRDIDNIFNFLRPEGIVSIKKQGVSVIDEEKESVTPLIDGKECAYTVFENGIAKCGIEIAYHEGKTTLQKPISCHLYPIRLNKYDKYIAVNYDRWDICDPARELGDKKKIRLYTFVRSALIRKFGMEWFELLKSIIKEMRENKKPD